MTNNSDAGTFAERADAAPARPTMRPFSRALPIAMLRAREAIMERFRPELNAHGVTDQQWRIIRVLADFGPAEILTISELCVIHPASLSRILPKLEDDGYITRRTNEADKRRVIVSLTEEGRAFFDSFAPHSQAVYAAIEDAIGYDRSRELCDLLDHVIDALSEPQDRTQS